MSRALLLALLALLVAVVAVQADTTPKPTAKPTTGKPTTHGPTVKPTTHAPTSKPTTEAPSKATHSPSAAPSELVSCEKFKSHTACKKHEKDGCAWVAKHEKCRKATPSPSKATTKSPTKV